MNHFENLPEPEPAPEHKPLSIRHVAIIAGRAVRPGDPDAEGWQIAAMVAPVLAAMSRPIATTTAALIEACSELIQASVPIVARALIRALRTLRAFVIPDILAIVEAERRAAEAAADDNDFDAIPKA